MSAARWGLVAAVLCASLTACEYREEPGTDPSAGASLVPPAGTGAPIFFTQQTLEPEPGIDEDVEAGIEADENAGVEGEHEIDEEPELGIDSDELDENEGVVEDEGLGADITEGVDEDEGVVGTDPLGLDSP